MTRAIVVSDLHLVYEGTEREAIEALINDLEDDPPDELILNGDVYELWRGDLAGVMWLASRWTEMLHSLCERGVDCTYVQGNHDDYLARHTDDNPEYPFDPQFEYETAFDGVDFYFTHGHKYEPTYIPPVNDLLSITNDHSGNAADWLWDNRPLQENPVENVALAALGPAASYLDPENTSKNQLRLDAIEAGVRADTAPEEWGVIGHTHTPYVDETERIANSGSMTAGQATYLEIIDGVPHLRDVGV